MILKLPHIPGSCTCSCSWEAGHLVSLLCTCEWRDSLITSASTVDNPFNLHNEMKLSLNGKNCLTETVVLKIVYKELRNRVITPPTVQRSFNNPFVNDVLEWKEMDSLPFRTFARISA